MSELAERCRELLEWQRTGILPDGAIRKLAKEIQSKNGGLSLLEHQALHLAETQTASEAFAALAAQQDGSWQPIETAPKDGNRFLAFEPRGEYQRYECWWQDDFSNWSGWQTDWDNEPNPTHWQPLPPPPAT